MEIQEKKAPKKSKKLLVTITLYVAAAVVAIIGAALLVNNVMLFRSTVSQYVAQGYKAATVRKQLVPAQLLPGIFQPIAVYGGIAFVLLAAGIINEKVSKCLGLLTKAELSSDVVDEKTSEQCISNCENTEVMENTEEIKSAEAEVNADEVSGEA